MFEVHITHPGERRAIHFPGPGFAASGSGVTIDLTPQAWEDLKRAVEQEEAVESGDFDYANEADWENDMRKEPTGDEGYDPEDPR